MLRKMKTSRIALYGPPINKRIDKGYGGGAGGYTRNMSAYVQFRFDQFSIFPVFHTVRGELQFGGLTSLVRGIVDFARIIRILVASRPDGIHILAQYRKATMREFLISFLAFVCRVPYLYEIKAGSFIEFYKNSGFVTRCLVTFILKYAKVILCEGQEYIPFLKREFDVTGYYFPNFVLASEVPKKPNTLFTGDALRVLFVGYCTRDKGVFSLAEGVSRFAKNSTKPVQLVLVGSEDPEFTKFADTFQCSRNLEIIRKGRLPHGDVLREMSKSDIYLYPSLHKGEGHNNSINEAMMFGLMIITTPIGFLPDVLDNAAMFIEDVEPDLIHSALTEVEAEKTRAQELALVGRHKLVTNYTDVVICRWLESHYQRLIHGP